MLVENIENFVAGFIIPRRVVSKLVVENAVHFILFYS